MIQPVYSKLAETVYTINNANRPWGTLIEEIPSDIGRSYAGYKRGGVLEGAEKMRKELMTAAVWMAGIPAFNKLGNLFCEHVLKIPMKIEYSNSAEGNSAIEDSINYLKNGLNPKNLDVSEIEHYKKTLAKKLDKTSVDKLVNQVKYAKQVTSITAVVLNCLAMGIVLPKINQAITQKKLDEQNAKKTQLPIPNMDDFINSSKKETPKNNEVSFTGGLADGVYNALDKCTYLTANSNTFRLVITDIPMILGRMATSRNKYEALEFLVMDGASVFFYNFCAGLVQKGMRKASDIPDINPKAAEIISQLPKSELETAFDLLKKGETSTKQLFEESSELIYKTATYGKYGKINAFIKDNEIKGVDEGVVKTLKCLEKTAKEKGEEYFKDGKINTARIEELAKSVVGKINKANALYLACGLLLSIIGLAVIIPKVTFWITEKLTGKNQFTGIAHYDDDNKKNVKEC